MAKLSKQPSKRKVAIKTTGARTRTEEGHLGYVRDAKSELFLLAVTNMVGEDTFYESASDRDQRFKTLIHQVAEDDPDWIARFVPYLRDEMWMRTASIVMAAELVRSVRQAETQFNSRQAVSEAIKRPDEPAEMLAYWLSQYGRPIPMAIRRGVRDSALRLYTPKNVIKYDGVRQLWRPADVISLLHIKPDTEEQSALFKWLLDRRYGNVNAEGPYMNIEMIANYEWLYTMPTEEREVYLDENDFEVFQSSGMTWEMISEWAGKMDAATWEKIIPSMGYMALLRNLRNFDQAEISDESREFVYNKLKDENEVRKSKQFPFRFLNAWKAVDSLDWGGALEKALDYSTQNIPELRGNTLVLVDWSQSMEDPVSGRSQLKRYEIAGIVAAALGKKNGHNADVVVYSDGWKRVVIERNASVLRTMEKINGAVNHGGTRTFDALLSSYTNHDRVIILTDEQAHALSNYSGSRAYRTRNAFGDLSDHPFQGSSDEQVKRLKKVPIYTFNVAGYRAAHLPDGEDNNYSFGGFNDSSFKLINLIEKGRSADWPF